MTDSKPDSGAISSSTFDGSIYQPPQADLSVASDEASEEFYVVSAKKFSILFIATLGVYSVYWFYQNWRNYKSSHQAKMWPVPRAIFNIFFVHSLFQKVDETIARRESDYSWSPSALATIFVILSVTSQVTDRLAQKDIWMPYADIVSFACFPLTFWVLLKAQKAINFSQGDATGSSNSNLTLYNYLWIVLGVCLWIFAGWAIVTLSA